MNDDLMSQIESLRSTLGKMEVALGSISEAIVWTDGAGRIQWCNAAFDRFVGKPHIALLGVSVVDIMPLKEHGTSLPSQAHPVSLILNKETDKSGYYEFIRGELVIPLEIMGWHVKVGLAEPSAVIVMRDKTGAKEMEQVRLQSTALEAAANAIVITDQKGFVIWCNRALTTLTGYSLDEVYGKTLNFLKSGEHDDGFYRNLWETILSGKIWEEETLNRKKDGCLYTEQQMITPVRNEDGEITHFISIKQDISDRKEAEAALRRSESRIRTIVNTAVDGIVTADDRGIIQSFNPAAEKLFGYSEEEVMGKNLNNLMPSPYREQHDASLSNYLRTGVRKVIGKGREAEALRKDGTIFPVELTVSEMRLGQQRMFTGIIRDITERKEFQKQLLEAKEAAEKANRTKSEFLANMSHEIRTPMNSIMGFTQLLLDEELSASQQEMLETVEGSAERLLGLIDEILDLSKIEADSIVLEEVPFALDSLVLETIQLIRPRVAEKAVRIRSDLEGGSQWVMGDPTRLRQVLLNLLANACKFTEQGEILTTLKKLEETKDGVLMEVALSDTGIGISGDKLDTIFQVFTQADGSTTRKYGGTGLGLTISQRLINMMGGEIKVESRAGEGATFRFSVWFKKGPAEAGPDKTPVETGEGKEIDREIEILLAEDDLANQKMTMLMLQKMGNAVDLAEDGVEAVERAKTRAYDIILMDIQMPRMGGIEATEKLRQAGVNTPIVAMTASVMKGDRERLLKAGMDDYIAKPIRRDIVSDILNRHAGPNFPRETPDSGQMSLPPIKTITEELGLDEEQYLEILMGFIEEKKKDMEDLEDALAQEDTELISRLAHKIKGSALNLRLDLMAQPAANIEKAAKEGDVSGIVGDWDALRRGFQVLREKGK